MKPVCFAFAKPCRHCKQSSEPNDVASAWKYQQQARIWAPACVLNGMLNESPVLWPESTPSNRLCKCSFAICQGMDYNSMYKNSHADVGRGCINSQVWQVLATK